MSVLPKTLDETLTRDVNEPLVDWLRFFAFPEATSEKEFMALSKRDEGIEMAVKEYKKFCSDPELRDLHRRREKFLLDTNTMLGDAEEKGEAKGLAKGLARGRAEGRIEGRAEGRIEGRVELLLQAIESRFGSTSEEFRAKLRAIDDSADVLRLLTYVMTSAQTLYDVEKAISQL